MLLSVRNQYTTLEVCSPGERRWLSQYLAFEDPKARFRGNPNEQNRMFDSMHGRFPTGFLRLVQKAAREENWHVDVVDKRERPCEVDWEADLSWLRDYQDDAVQVVTGTPERTGKERGIVWAPTGSGKSELAIGFMLRLPCRWLLLVHRSNLVHQFADRWELRTGEKAGRVCEGSWSVGERLTCASFQTMHAGLKSRSKRAHELLLSAQGIVCDESHTVAANTFWVVSMHTPSAYYRIGISGTPLARSDRRSILAIAALGPVIYRVRADTLIEKGAIARPIIRMVPLAQPCDLPTWQGVYGRCIVRSTARNGLLARICIKAEKPCLLFIKELWHGHEMVRRLSQAGLKADFTHGAHSASWRKNMIRALERGALDVLVSSVVLSEGADIPSLRSVVVGSGGKSAIQTLQRLGRGSRTDQGRKMSFDVYDVADRGDAHGWLARHTRARVKAFVSEGFETREETIA